MAAFCYPATHVAQPRSGTSTECLARSAILVGATPESSQAETAACRRP